MIYRIAAALSFILMIILLGLYIRRYSSGTLSFFQQRQGTVGFMRRLGYFILLFSFLIMGISAITPVILGADHLSGLMLIIHVTLAPVFIGTVAIFLILTAHHMVFNEQDWESLRIRQFSKKDIFWQKLIFWFFIITATISAGSIILMLFPLFGSDGQEVLLDIHRSASVVLVLIAAGHFWTFRPFNGYTA